MILLLFDAGYEVGRLLTFCRYLSRQWICLLKGRLSNTLMRTIFTLDKPKVKLARQIEATKSTINKYLKRERSKQLPEGVDFWDFACKFGDTKEEAKACHWKDIFKLMDAAEAREQITFYVQIIAVDGYRQKNVKPSSTEL